MHHYSRFFFVLPLRRFCYTVCFQILIQTFFVFCFYNLHFQFIVLSVLFCIACAAFSVRVRFIFRCMGVCFYSFYRSLLLKKIHFTPHLSQAASISKNSFSAFCYPYFWFAYFCFILRAVQRIVLGRRLGGVNSERKRMLLTPSTDRLGMHTLHRNEN